MRRVEIVTALSKDGFEERKHERTTSRRDKRPAGGVWQGVNPGTGSVALGDLGDSSDLASGHRLHRHRWGVTQGAVEAWRHRQFFQLAADALLQVLLTMPRAGALDPDALEIDERAASLWRNNRARAVELTQLSISREGTAVGRRFLAGIARSIDADGVAAVTAGRPELIRFFCRHNPELLRAAELWGLGREVARARDRGARPTAALGLYTAGIGAEAQAVSTE